MDRRQTTIQWPVAIDDRLNHLVELARAEGERLSRSELLAALVAFATPDGEGLGVIVRAYRRETEESMRPHAAPAEARLGRPRSKNREGKHVAECQGC